MVKKYQAPIVQKAFQILRVVSRSETGMGISEISSRLDIGKSTVHGITAALEQQGALARDPKSKRYTVGLTLLELGRSVNQRVDIQRIARPAMETLLHQCRETVFLGLRNGNHVTIIDRVESPKDFKISSPIGTALPLLAGAVGKAFLSTLPRDEVRRLLTQAPLPRYTPATITDPAAYEKGLETIRSQGYALDDEEYIAGVCAVAVPLAACGPYTPALWVVGFKAGMDDKKLNRLVTHTLEAAGTINRALVP
ncbi:MAG: IclR family transcriptional regulator [Desulfobacterales bacterium]|nr:IclR family transcriptional regulator [Desulfobacterales bacterium]